VASVSVFFMPRVVGLGAATLRCWVLHGGGPLGVVVSTPSAPLSTQDHLRGFDTSLWAVVGASYGCALSPPLSV
jgi:hypothetical protein